MQFNRVRRLILSMVMCLCIAASAWAANVGTYWGATWGVPRSAMLMSAAAGATSYAMAALNTGWSARHLATSTLDVKAVKVHWGTVTAGAGQISVRIETNDATTGKPTGTLYDANATLTGQVPATGIQTYTFAVLPSTGRTVGAFYHVVILTTTGGTTIPLNSYISETGPALYPAAVLTAADGTVRSNFAEVTNSEPIVVLVMEDDTEVSLQEGMTPYSTVTANNVYGTAAVAAKLTTLTTMSVVGIEYIFTVKTGSPADMRLRVFDSSNNTVSGSTITLDKDHVANAATRGGKAFFDTPITLPAGTYRIVADSSASDASNNFRISSADSISALATPSGYVGSTTADVSGAPTVTWTDSTTKMIPMRFLVDSMTIPSASGVIGG